MSVPSVGDGSLVTGAEELQAMQKPDFARAREVESGLTDDGDTVSISDMGRRRSAAMMSEGGELKDREGRGSDKREGGTVKVAVQMGGKSGDSSKEDAVDELKDTETDISKKEDEIEQVKTTFIGTDDDKERKLKELKQDLDDLKDTKKKLESELAS